MTSYTIPDSYEGLKGKNILITGCASGIGRETSKFAYKHGANLALLDYNEDDARSLIEELGGDLSRTLFCKVDVTNWKDLRTAFEATIRQFGSIDAVISNAGMSNENLLEDELDQEGLLKQPNLKCLEVNLVAHLLITKLAVHYFKKIPGTPKQLIYTASAAAFTESPPLFQYGAAKTGIVGLMRALRPVTQRWGISVNLVAPWMTVTPMLPQMIRDVWGELPKNDGLGIGKALLLPIVRPGIHGKSLWVGGNEITELEDKLMETRPQWMGAELHRGVLEGDKRMQVVVLPP